MISKILFTVFALIAGLNSMAQAEAGPKWKDSIERIIQPLVQTNNFNGNVLVVKNGQQYFSGSYGLAQREFGVSHSKESKFMLASVSMIFTSAAIMKLVEAGAINLNDYISEYVPDYPLGGEITIHQMLSQRSGIPAIGYDGELDYNRMTKFKHTTRELFDYFKDYPLLFKPGERYNHGRSEYILLALIIEEVSGKPFGTFLAEEIFAPLNILDTGHYGGDEFLIPNRSKGYAPKELYELEPAYHLDWSSKTGHASIYSTTGDLIKFGQAIIDAKLLTKESWDKIFTDYGQDVGYGWFIRPHLNRTRYQMNGRSPGFSSYLAIYPEEEMIICVLSNLYISVPVIIGMDIAAAAFGEPVDTMPLVVKRLSETAVAPILGSYKFGPDFYRPDFLLDVKLENGSLSTQWGKLIPVDRGKSPIREFILRNFWSHIRFLDEAGVYTMQFDRFYGKKE